MNETNETEKVNTEAESTEEAKTQEDSLKDESDNVVEMNKDEKAAVDETLEVKKSEWDALEKEKNDFKDKFFYIAAEKENLQKRFDREKENLLKYGNEKVLSGLLSVVDNLGLTLNAIANDEDEKVKNIFVGIEMVNQQFSEVLKNNGLEEIKSVGETFDPNCHEALMQREEEGKDAGVVLEEVQKGYRLNGRVVRAAKVIISK
jgi:molecular chaperone GrpE